MANRIFISYSSHDKEAADTVCRVLEEQGVNCWITPRNVPPGANWAASIIDAIEAAPAIVLVFSEHVNESEQVKNEVERAVHRKKPFFPIKLSPVMPSKDLEYFISRWQFLDASVEPLEHVLQQLADALRPLVASPALHAGTAPDVLRGGGAAVEPEHVLVLEASREDNLLKLSAHERRLGEERPVKHYEHQTVDFPSVLQEADALMVQLHQAAQSQQPLDTAAWQGIQERGAALYSQLFTPDIQQQLRDSVTPHLLLYIDDALVQIPWELLFDGSAFLCRRFNMGRIVSTQQAVVADKQRPQGNTLRMLIVANPTQDLEAASREGRTIQDELTAGSSRFRVAIGGSSVSTAYLKEHVSQYDALHYAGHADYDLHNPAQSGWLMADGKLTAEDVLHMGQVEPMPALVFSNACQSGQTTAWDGAQGVGQGIYGLANAFLLAGAQHYIGTFWEIPDQASAYFASYFYQVLASGAGVGAALRQARQALAERYGEESVVWASYVLYGDPTFRYLDGLPEPLPSQAAVPQAPATHAETVTAAAQEALQPPTRSKLPLVLGAVGLVACVVLAAVLWFRPARDAGLKNPVLAQAYEAVQRQDWAQAETLFQQLGQHKTPLVQSQGYAGLATVAFAQGDSQQALVWTEKAARLDPEVAQSHVVRGHLLYDQGKLDEALVAYQTATEKSVTVPWQQALAADRLGRIYATQGKTDLALTHYTRAINQAPNFAPAYTNKAHLLEQSGQFEAALALYRQAAVQQPGDPVTAILLRAAEQRQQLVEDKEKQARIDQLVADLLQAHREGRAPAETGDGWTSSPLTLAFLAFQHQGVPAPRAGADEVLLRSLAEALQDRGRIVLIDRAHLDALLAELKLSASELVNPDVAVRVGKILAARVLATGSIIRTGSEAQLSVRLIETETTRVKAAATEVIQQSNALDTVTGPLAQTLLGKLQQSYPLQGRIVRVTPQGVLVNIGAAQGVSPGVVLQVFGTEEPIKVDGKVIDYFREPVGQIKVTSVQDNIAQATIVESTQDFQPDWKVQEIQEEKP